MSFDKLHNLLLTNITLGNIHLFPANTTQNDAIYVSIIFYIYRYNISSYYLK